MRRLVPIAIASLVMLSGCGTERRGPVGESEASFSPAPSPTTTPSRSPRGDTRGSLTGFPLALGYDEENGDDHSPVVVTEQPATKAFELCGVPAWDPNAGTTDLIGVEWRGEAEWSRGRTLVLYPSVDDASAAVTAADDALADCPEEPGEVGYGTAHTLLDQAMGDESVAWTDTYWYQPEAERLFDTGLTVYHLVRVGLAVLMSYEYGEGNGSEGTRKRALADFVDLEGPVVARMGELPAEDSVGGSFTLTPTGGGPFLLGMSLSEALAAAPDAQVYDGEDCTELSWTSASGTSVHAEFQAGNGLSDLTADNAATTEGTAVGDTLDQLRRTYANLETAGTGSFRWLSDQAGAAYFFDLDGSYRVVKVMLVIDSHPCWFGVD
jgi:hypothetical protein